MTALRGAGAIIIGKTNLSELAAWPFTETSTWGATRNPWNTDYSPGGSSGGSAAAVAAGLCGMALGSDGLGSIRAPASFTGVFGLKPQRDRVWHDADNWHGLAVNGPLARSVTDGALFLDATAGPRSTTRIGSHREQPGWPTQAGGFHVACSSVPSTPSPRSLEESTGSSTTSTWY
ncbi:MAG: amidase family protein [Acidimicrobiales bacterium]